MRTIHLFCLPFLAVACAPTQDEAIPPRIEPRIEPATVAPDLAPELDGACRGLDPFSIRVMQVGGSATPEAGGTLRFRADVRADFQADGELELRLPDGVPAPAIDRSLIVAAGETRSVEFELELPPGDRDYDVIVGMRTTDRLVNRSAFGNLIVTVGEPEREEIVWGRSFDGQLVRVVSPGSKLWRTKK